KELIPILSDKDVVIERTKTQNRVSIGRTSSEASAVEADSRTDAAIAESARSGTRHFPPTPRFLPHGSGKLASETTISPSKRDFPCSLRRRENSHIPGRGSDP